MKRWRLDVHKRFAEATVYENGRLRRLGRIETGQLRAFAQSLGPTDHVVLEVDGDDVTTARSRSSTYGDNCPPTVPR